MPALAGVRTSDLVIEGGYGPPIHGPLRGTTTMVSLHDSPWTYVSVQWKFRAPQRENPMKLKKESRVTPDLSLTEAVKTGRLKEFIAQEEARGVSPADLKEFQELSARLIKDTPQEDRTSRSHGRGGSNGK